MSTATSARPFDHFDPDPSTRESRLTDFPACARQRRLCCCRRKSGCRTPTCCPTPARHAGQFRRRIDDTPFISGSGARGHRRALERGSTRRVASRTFRPRLQKCRQQPASVRHALLRLRRAICAAGLDRNEGSDAASSARRSATLPATADPLSKRSIAARTGVNDSIAAQACRSTHHPNACSRPPATLATTGWNLATVLSGSTSSCPCSSRAAAGQFRTRLPRD